MSSNPSNRTAAQRERERRAAAKARRQAAASVAPAPAGDVAERKSPPVAARRETKAVVVADPDAVAITLGDEHGDVATWMMLGVVFLLALLVVAIAFAS